jgi:membrane-bound metal-dependent hydrolase YbcI (DUF457 family)
MTTKLKIILVTVVCTTIGWVAVIAGLLWLWPGSGDSVALAQFSRPGVPSRILAEHFRSIGIGSMALANFGPSEFELV